jgi:hypothetical protein
VRLVRVGVGHLIRRSACEKEVRVIAPRLAGRSDPVRKERQRARIGEPIVSAQEIREAQHALANGDAIGRDVRPVRVRRYWSLRWIASEQDSGLLEEFAERGHQQAPSGIFIDGRLAARQSRGNRRSKLFTEPIALEPDGADPRFRGGVLRLDRPARKDEGIGRKGAARATARQIDLQGRTNEDDRRRQAHIAHEAVASCHAVAKTSRCK